MRVEFKVLGAPRVIVDGDPYAPATPRLGALLAALLARPNQVCVMERLADCVWDRPPESWRPNLRTLVATLRRGMTEARDRLASHTGGYWMHLDQDELDVHTFQRLRRMGVREIRRGDHERGARCLEAALAVWTGSPLTTVARTRPLTSWAESLEQDRLHTFEALTEARLRLGECQSLIGELQTHLADHPTREGMWGQLIRATYLAGDAAGALALFDRARITLAQSLGIDPGPQLRSIQGAVLRRSDSELIWPRPTDQCARCRLPGIAAGSTVEVDLRS